MSSVEENSESNRVKANNKYLQKNTTTNISHYLYHFVIGYVDILCLREFCRTPIKTSFQSFFTKYSSCGQTLPTSGILPETLLDKLFIHLRLTSRLVNCNLPLASTRRFAIGMIIQIVDIVDIVDIADCTICRICKFCNLWDTRKPVLNLNGIRYNMGLKILANDSLILLILGRLIHWARIISSLLY